MKKTLYLIHHSHTDIGYTDTQERALHHQASYISHIIEHFKTFPDSSFRWNCETFVAVEAFLKNATPEEILAFSHLVSQHKIDLSANFANFSEILDPEIMHSIIARAIAFAKEHHLTIKCAMQADVNGFALGYANALCENGIEFFLTLVHTHHGMFPLFKKQTPFYWEMPSGKKLLVWSGEHYMFGNAFGFAQGAMASYGFDYEIDVVELNRNYDHEWLYHAENRMKNYLKTLNEQAYPYDFFPACIQGKYTDNAMPNFSIPERVAQWNEKFSHWVEVKMVTLTEFYEVCKNSQDIPTYKGEWPDWWTDGVASAPRELKIFKNNQIKYNLIKSLNTPLLTQKVAQEIEYDLALYAEHTYGAWSSIHNPYDTFAHESWAGKQWYLFNAMRNIDKLWIHYEHELGSRATKFDFSGKFLLKNPNSVTVKEVIKLPFHSADYLFLNGNYTIQDSLKVYDYFCDGGNYPHICVELKPYETKEIHVTPLGNQTKKLEQKGLNIPMYSRFQIAGTDGISDIYSHEISNSLFSLTSSNATSPFFKISFSDKGIYSIMQTVNQCELLNKNQGLFQGVYEVSKSTPRSQMGRNRKGIEVERSFSKLIKVTKLEENSELMKFSLLFSLKGCQHFEQIITLYRTIEKISLSVKLHKEGVNEPESLYFALPFLHNSLHLDKGSHSCVPRKEQLPGTLIDFYAAFDGVIFENTNLNALVSTPDTHLIHYGNLEFKDRTLHVEGENLHEEECYIWAMNNIWETNFIAHLGDFYEFRFEISTHSNASSIEEGFKSIKSFNRKIIAINI